MSEQRCGTCKWFQIYGIDGSCRFPLPEWVIETLLKLDAAVFPGNCTPPIVRTVTEGKDCPTWHAK